MGVQDTSIKAYHEIIEEGIVGKRQAEVFELLTKTSDLTDSEIAIKLGYKDMNKTRPRRKDLVDLGIVEEHGKRHCSITKRTVIQWRIKPKLTIADILRNKKNFSKRKKCPFCKGTGIIQKPQTDLENWVE
jgi:transcription initiation factor IIE alpha subunit